MSMPSRKSKRAFVSFSDKDREFAEGLMAHLDRAGIKVYSALTIQERKEWASVISDLVSDFLRDSDAVVFLVGKAASGVQRREWQLALEQKWEQPAKKFVTVLIDGAQLPPFLSECPVIMSKRKNREAVFAEVEELVGREVPKMVAFEPSQEWKERLDYIGKVAAEFKK